MRRGLLLASAPSLFNETPSISIIFSPTSQEYGGGLADALTITGAFIVTQVDFSPSETLTGTIQVSPTETDQAVEINALSETFALTPAQTDSLLISPAMSLAFSIVVSDEQSVASNIVFAFGVSIVEEMLVERTLNDGWVSSTSITDLQEYIQDSWAERAILAFTQTHLVEVSSSWTSSTIIESFFEALASSWQWRTVLLVTSSYPTLSNPFRIGQTSPLPPGVPSEVTLKK